MGGWWWRVFYNILRVPVWPWPWRLQAEREIRPEGFYRRSILETWRTILFWRLQFFFNSQVFFFYKNKLITSQATFFLCYKSLFYKTDNRHFKKYVLTWENIFFFAVLGWFLFNGLWDLFFFNLFVQDLQYESDTSVKTKTNFKLYKYLN